MPCMGAKNHHLGRLCRGAPLECRQRVTTPVARHPTLNHPPARSSEAYSAAEQSGGFPPIAWRCRPLVRRAQCFVVLGAGHLSAISMGFLLLGGLALSCSVSLGCLARAAGGTCSPVTATP